MRTLVSERVDDAPTSPPEEPSAPWTQKLAPLVIAGVVVVGVALRFVTTSALWLDEALSVNIAKLPVGDLLDALRHDGHPPLYYLLLHGWMQVFGEGDVAVRALSGIIGVATLPLAYVAGRRLAGVAGGRWALVVVALSPYSVRYATETRMYSLVMLLTLVGYLVLTDALHTPTAGRLAALTLVSGTLLLTHYWSFYLVAAVGLLLVVRWWRVPGERPTTVRLTVAVAAGGLLFLPWLGGFLYQGAHTGTPWGAPYRPTELVQTTLDDLGGGLVSESFLAGTVIVVLALVALFAARASRDELTLDLRTTPLVRREVLVVAVTAALGCAVGYATSATYQSRYAAVFVPLLLVAVAVGITRFVGPARLVAGGSLVALSLAGLVWIQAFERTQSEEVAAAVAERAEPGDVVVYCPDQLGPAYSRAMPSDITQVVYPTLGPPQRVDWVDYGDRNAAADPAAIARDVLDMADGHGVFVVWMAKYRTLEGQCEDLVNALGRGELIVSEDQAKYYEPANVHWFPAGRTDATGGTPGLGAAASSGSADDGA
ncbi:MAG TPA: glycosyltransferase family 39 protein [Acidimicrobiales bacterium]|nr:glycosyltransferase family 39 protein [Acidimicrobiales bacterium]